QASGVLRAGLVLGLAGVDLAFTAAALLMPVPVNALIFGFGLGAYMLGATVLLVLGSERLLLIVLAPGVLGSAAFLALGRPPQLEYAVWAALAATPLLAVGLALICTSRGTGPRPGGQPVPGPAPGRPDRRAAERRVRPGRGRPGDLPGRGRPARRRRRQHRSAARLAAADAEHGSGRVDAHLVPAALAAAPAQDA